MKQLPIPASRANKAFTYPHFGVGEPTIFVGIPPYPLVVKHGLLEIPVILFPAVNLHIIRALPS